MKVLYIAVQGNNFYQNINQTEKDNARCSTKFFNAEENGGSKKIDNFDLAKYNST
jgi:hypothetical protein